MSSPTALLPPGEPGEPNGTDASALPMPADGHTASDSEGPASQGEGTSAGSVALGNILQDPDAAEDAGPEVHLTGRAARGAVGEVHVLLPRRFDDPNGQPRETTELELDGENYFVIRTSDPVDQALRLKLRRRGLPGPTGARGDILLDVRPDETLPLLRPPDRPPATRVTFAVVAITTIAVLALVAWRACGG